MDLLNRTIADLTLDLTLPGAFRDRLPEVKLRVLGLIQKMLDLAVDVTTSGGAQPQVGITEEDAAAIGKLTFSLCLKD